MSKLTDEVASLRKKIQEVHVPQDLAHRVSDQLTEIERLEADVSARVHAEGMLRYIDWVVHLPWKVRSEDQLDLTKAREILEKNHYGLAPVKERILEYLSILTLNRGKLEQKPKEDERSHAILARRAPILCLVGLVGTGKTTLAKSIAQAMGRQFVRIPL